MKKLRCLPILLTLLSSFSCITNAHESIKLEKNILSNDEESILSPKGKERFENLVKSLSDAKEKTKNGEIKQSNPKAGTYKSLTGIQKLGIFGVPPSSLALYFLYRSINSPAGTESQPDGPIDYIKASSSFSIPITLDSFKSLVCIFENLKFGQFKNELDDISVPKEGTSPLIGRTWEKIKWGQYGQGQRPYYSEQFLCAVQRLAIHKSIYEPLTELKLKNWMKTHEIDKMTDDDLKKKWNNIHPEYRETIKSIFTDSITKNIKPNLCDYVVEFSSGENTEVSDAALSRIITLEGVRKYVNEVNKGDLVTELTPVS